MEQSAGVGAEALTDARELLQRAGGVPGRRVNVEDMLNKLAAAGHVLVPPVRDFLTGHSGLMIATNDGRRVLRIDGHEAARHADPHWCAAYARGIGRALTPVGEYSHMLIMIDESGAFWGGFDAYYGFLGRDIAEVVHALLVEPGSRRLDQEVTD